MKYTTRKGIILSEIAGEYTLIAAQALRKEVPYVTMINETGAFCWHLLEEGIDKEELCTKLIEEFDIEEGHDVKQDVDALLDYLKSHNYIEEVTE